MRVFLAGILLGLLIASMPFNLANTPSPQADRRETLWLGIGLTLGMPEDTVIKKLAESGHPARKLTVPAGLAAKGVTSMWDVNEMKGNHGLITFALGKLNGVQRYLLPNDYGGGAEFGRQLYFAIRDLENEGNSRCTIETQNGEVPDFAIKNAYLHCGKKTINVELQKIEKNDETVSLELELNAK
jgi:hypothetical protein